MPRGFSRKYSRSGASRRLAAARKKRSLGRLQRAAVARIAKKVVNKSKESKRHCIDYESGLSVTTTASFTSLYSIAQGDGATTRDGSFIQPTKVYIKYKVRSSAVSTANAVRVMLIQTKRGVTSLSGSDIPTYLGCYETDMLSKYNVLYDRTHNIVEYGIVAQTGVNYINVYGKRLRRCQWDDASTSAVAPNEGGAVYLVCVSDDGAAPNPDIQFVAQAFWKEV